MTSPSGYRPGARDIFGQIPITVVIIGIWAVGLLLALAAVPIASYLVFVPAGFQALTGALTYPLAIGADPINVFFAGLVFYWCGGSLERGWGWRAYLAFLIGVTLSGLLLYQVGFALMTRGVLTTLGSPWLLVDACMVAWALLNPSAVVRLYFVIPVSGRILVWVITGLAFLFVFPRELGLLWFIWGLFGLGSIVFAYLFVHYGWARDVKWGTTGKRGQRLRHPASRMWDPLVRSYREWQRRRRAAQLARMFGDIDDHPRR
jgi:hypothetical protein